MADSVTYLVGLLPDLDKEYIGEFFEQNGDEYNHTVKKHVMLNDFVAFVHKRMQS